MKAPFASSSELFRSQGRLAKYPLRTLWLKDGSGLIVEDYDVETKDSPAWLVSTREGSAPVLLRTNNGRDLNDTMSSGAFITEVGAHTSLIYADEFQQFDRVLSQDGPCLYLRGFDRTGASERPFADRFNLTTHRRTRVFESPSGRYDEVVSLLDPSANHLLISSQDRFTPPNFKVVSWTTLGRKQDTALTHITDPYPLLTHARHEVISYQRADGVTLKGELYYPTSYRPGDKVPVVIWGYPSVRADTSTTTQFHDTSESKFPRVSIIDGLPLTLITHSYALFIADMPLTGTGDPNAATNEQLAANAKAAVDLLVRRGLADPSRIGIGGHSYGGFMAANLLENTKLFAAGVGASGLYNLTLTPGGFASEQGSYWKKRAIYEHLSPFDAADKLNAPFLMFHGDNDDSTALPIQSVNFLEALEDVGKDASLILLPRETHDYRAKESHREIQGAELSWFDRYLKGEVPKD